VALPIAVYSGALAAAGSASKLAGEAKSLLDGVVGTVKSLIAALGIKGGTSHLTWSQANEKVLPLATQLTDRIQETYSTQIFAQLAQELPALTADTIEGSNMWDAQGRQDIVKAIRQSVTEPGTVYQHVQATIWRMLIWIAQRVDLDRFDQDYTAVSTNFLNRTVYAILAKFETAAGGEILTPEDVARKLAGNQLLAGLGLPLIVLIVLLFLGWFFWGRKKGQ